MQVIVFKSRLSNSIRKDPIHKDIYRHSVNCKTSPFLSIDCNAHTFTR